MAKRKTTTTEQQKPTAIGYIRVSTRTQVEDGNGLDVQREKIAGWCAYQGIELAAIESDEGVSGSAMDNRPGLRRTLQLALSTPGAVLVVYKLDRLGRNAIDVQETLAVLLDAGVRVVSLGDGVDSASGMGAALLKLLTGILATFAELEKEAIVTRLKDGRRQADQADRVYASEPRYGRRIADAEAGTLATDPEEARAVARVHELRAEGRTIREVATSLEAEGFKPRRGARWSLSVVHHIATGHRAPKPAKTSARIERARQEILAGVITPAA
jgi:site-specific DNA recombinase